MITRIFFYLMEAGVLAGAIAWIALPLFNKALMTLGHTPRYATSKSFVIIWACFFGIGAAGGELVGPAFLWVYGLTVVVVGMSVVARVAAMIVSKKFRIVRVREDADEARASSRPLITWRRTPG